MHEMENVKLVRYVYIIAKYSFRFRY